MIRSLLRRHVNAAVEDALVAFCGTRGPAPSDEALWATFAWRFGYGWLNELVARGKSEMRMHKGGVAPVERPRILQGIMGTGPADTLQNATLCTLRREGWPSGSDDIE